MQKLKNSIINTMMKLHMTKAEVDFILELSHYQDDTGKIYGVYYKDICKAIKISAETFYVTMRSLEQKQLIQCEKNCQEDWDILILNNDFSQGNYQEGYVNTGHDIFYHEKFKALKANEKLIALQFLKNIGAGKKYKIGIEKFYAEYGKLLKVAERTLRIYLHSLKRFFRITKKKKEYCFTALDGVFKECAPTDSDVMSEHLGKVTCRRNRLSYTKETLRDTVSLIRQYEQELKEKVASVFLNAVKDSIEKQNKDQSCRRKWNRTLNPKFVHKLITLCLN